jgi:hypothetical protein
VTDVYTPPPVTHSRPNTDDLSRVKCVGDEIQIQLPGGTITRTTQTLPEDKIAWINQGRKKTYAQLLGEGDESLRFASHHLPVVSTYSEDQLFPFNMANKGIGFIPKAEYIQEYIEFLEDVHKRTLGMPWKESLQDRVKAVRKFYFTKEKIDYRCLSSLEIFEKNTFRNLQKTPLASLLYTGTSPEWVSFQVNTAVEIVPQGDPRHTFVMRVRTLFESEAFHIYQPQFPYAYFFWICEVKDKSPFRVKVQPDKVQYMTSDDGEIEWTQEAVEAIGRAPGMIQKYIRDLIENHARERGYKKIDKKFVTEAREQFEPKG